MNAYLHLWNYLRNLKPHSRFKVVSSKNTTVYNVAGRQRLTQMRQLLGWNTVTMKISRCHSLIADGSIQYVWNGFGETLIHWYTQRFNYQTPNNICKVKKFCTYLNIYIYLLHDKKFEGKTALQRSRVLNESGSNRISGHHCCIIAASPRASRQRPLAKAATRNPWPWANYLNFLESQKFSPFHVVKIWGIICEYMIYVLK